MRRWTERVLDYLTAMAALMAFMAAGDNAVAELAQKVSAGAWVAIAVVAVVASAILESQGDGAR